jgi:hypothetical protein
LHRDRLHFFPTGYIPLYYMPLRRLGWRLNTLFVLLDCSWIQITTKVVVV